jgi:hypothetical protein
MRLQLNLLVEKNAGIPYMMSGLPRLLLPVLWFESDAELPESMAGSLALLVNLPVIMKACGLAGMLLGLLGMVSMLTCIVRLKEADKPDIATAKTMSLVDCDYAKVLISQDPEESPAPPSELLISREELLLPAQGSTEQD